AGRTPSRAPLGSRLAGPPRPQRPGVRRALQLGSRRAGDGGPPPAAPRAGGMSAVRFHPETREPGGRMLINVSARHCTVGESVRRRAKERPRRMSRFEPGIEPVDVIFERDHGLYAVEARTFVTGRSVVVAHAAATDPRAALDQAVSRTA